MYSCDRPNSALLFVELYYFFYINIRNPVTISYHKVFIFFWNIIFYTKNSFSWKSILSCVYKCYFKIIYFFIITPSMKLRISGFCMDSKIVSKMFLVNKVVFYIISLVAKSYYKIVKTVI